ncbi:Polyamine aminopropyltransferase [Candidatus Calditenuaceae archaeon HR02]|nr:Polyamine aminopropyltransferase [Candidatus Calditenuaceae archaeon HR02]
MSLGRVRILALVFLAGAAVMVIELAGSRLLTPVFGSSVFVWGSIIGVVLSSLAAGYYLGGRISDLRPDPRLLDTIVFTGGVLVISIPFLSPVSIEAVVSAGLEERWGALLASLALLAPSNLLLGMVSPFAVKLATSELGELGSSAGYLYAVSTLGSIFGTFGTVFILIPALDVRTIFLGVGLALMAVSMVRLGTSSKATFAVILLFLLSPLGLVGGQVVAASGQVVESRETPYNSLVVARSDDLQVLYLNGLPHSGMSLKNPHELVFTYTKFFESALALNSGADDVLFIGGGGFSGPKYFLRKYTNITVEVVEIDPVVVEVAKKYFHVPDDERLIIHIDDGRVFLQRVGKKFDAIIIDAYAKTYIPYHLLTLEFFRLVRDKLESGGVVVSNIIASVTGDTSEILWSTYKTMSLVFPKIYVVKASDQGAPLVQNIILVACVEEDCDLIGSLSRWGSREVEYLVARGLWSRVPDLSEYKVLTDNYSPVESLINPVTGKPYSVELESGEFSVPAILMGGSNSLALAVVTLAATYWLAVLISDVTPRRGVGQREYTVGG